jgi:hypothetical protein
VRQITEDEKTALHEQLLAVHESTVFKGVAADAKGMNAGPSEEPIFSKVKYFKVKWAQALDLVASRRVFLKGGMAYIPRDKLVNIIVNVFRSYVRPNRSCRSAHVVVVGNPVALSLLCCAVLCCAVLCCAVLCCAVLCCAVLLCCSVLRCAALRRSASSPCTCCCSCHTRWPAPTRRCRPSFAMSG